MSEEQEEEPSIEEILDSIRQIISDDDDEGAENEGGEAEAAPSPEPAPEAPKAEAEAPPEPKPEPPKETPEAPPEDPTDIDFDAIELTERLDDDAEDEPEDSPAAPEEMDIDMLDSPEDASAEDEGSEEEVDIDSILDEMPAPNDESEPIEVDMEDAENMLSQTAESDFDSVLTENAADAAYEGFAELAKKTAIEHNGITVEEIVRAELRPLLKDWLDKHLPTIIERLVQEELERVAKRAMEE